MTANLDKWPAFHSTGEDHPPLPLFCFPGVSGTNVFDRVPRQFDNSYINLMAIAPYGRRATLLENEGSSAVVLKRPINNASGCRSLRIFDFDPGFRRP
jgi:hypothetical protein